MFLAAFVRGYGLASIERSLETLMNKRLKVFKLNIVPRFVPRFCIWYPGPMSLFPGRPGIWRNTSKHRERVGCQQTIFDNLLRLPQCATERVSTRNSDGSAWRSVCSRAVSSILGATVSFVVSISSNGAPAMGWERTLRQPRSIHS